MLVRGRKCLCLVSVVEAPWCLGVEPAYLLGQLHLSWVFCRPNPHLAYETHRHGMLTRDRNTENKTAS